jgi:hypothetical protein
MNNRRRTYDRAVQRTLQAYIRMKNFCYFHDLSYERGYVLIFRWIKGRRKPCFRKWSHPDVSKYCLIMKKMHPEFERQFEDFDKE